MMKTTTLPILLLLVLAPLPTLADEVPAAPVEEAAATAQPDSEELPYGAGYEARRRQGRGHGEPGAEQEAARGEAGTRDRNRTESRAASNDARTERAQAERASATRTARREARERWGQHGGTRN